MSRARNNPYLTNVSRDYLLQKYKDDEALSLSRLSSALERIWEYGKNIVIGWNYGPHYIDLCFCPIEVAVNGYPRFPRIFDGQRLLNEKLLTSLCEKLGIGRVRVDTPLMIGEERYDLHVNTVNNLVKRYCIAHSTNRAVILFDIVKFSLFSPVEQLCQLKALECYIDNAAKIMADLNLPVDLHRSTTGDGYYVWNDNTGHEHNVRTYIALIIMLILNALNPNRLILRSAFAIGSHFTYHHVDSLPRGIEYIVGDVTIRLSRIVNSCLPDQLLTSYFADDKKRTTILQFMDDCQALVDKILNLAISSRPVSVLRTYLTGYRGKEGFEVQTYCVTDKHGISHIVCNVKVNVYFIGSDPVKLGKMTTELEGVPHLIAAS